jgi:hypothetical protein
LQLKLNQYVFALSLIALAVLACIRAQAQALPTATASFSVEAFGGFSGDYTGLALAKNGDITAGVDVGFRSFAGFYPSLEGRGSYPIVKGQTVNMENAVGGIRLSRHKYRFQGYGDALFGRGKLNFPGNGYPVPSGLFNVVSNTSNVLSFGGGVDYFTAGHFGIKGDFQIQRYETPVTVDGTLYSKVFTAALIYRFGTGGVNGLRGRHF